MPRRQAENTEKKNQKERRVMSQKERVDLIEVDLLDMCKYILSKWVFILIGMVVFAGAGFGYAKVKSKTEYSSKMQVYVTVPKTSDKVLIRDDAGALVYDYARLIDSDIITKEIAKIALEKLEIDDLGLDNIDRKILKTIILNYTGGPVGIETLSSTIGEEVETIEDVYEPYLMQMGFIARTPRGRIATPNAYKHLGIEMVN